MEAIYTCDDAARAHLEKLLWPQGPVCPHCGVVGEATAMQGKSHRKGLYNCRACVKPFSVTVGTVYEGSHIGLAKWVYATHLVASSKKGISALQLQRMLELGSYRSAWFMLMRIREAMRETDDTPMGGEGKVVEADETYYGKVATPPTLRTDGTPFLKRKPSARAKRVVIGLVERGGKARMFHVVSATKRAAAELVLANIKPQSFLYTDESPIYTGAAKAFAAHETVKHTAGEYARGPVNTNSVEGFFGVFKRGMSGVYQHCGEHYTSRYLDEFTFRHNTRVKLGFNDKDRAALILKGGADKRLTYRRTASVAAT